MKIIKFKTQEERKEELLKCGELELAIEGRFTNLRIWLSKRDNKVRFRLDKGNCYSAPLSFQSLIYLNKENKVLNQLNEAYGFDGATIDNIDNIVELTKDMVYRACISW